MIFIIMDWKWLPVMNYLEWYSVSLFFNKINIVVNIEYGAALSLLTPKQHIPWITETNYIIRGWVYNVQMCTMCSIVHCTMYLYHMYIVHIIKVVVWHTTERFRTHYGHTVDTLRIGCGQVEDRLRTHCHTTHPCPLFQNTQIIVDMVAILHKRGRSV